MHNKAIHKCSYGKDKVEFDEAFRRFLTLCTSKNRKKNLAAGMILFRDGCEGHIGKWILEKRDDNG